MAEKKDVRPPRLALERMRELRLERGLPLVELQARLRFASRVTDLGHRVLAFYLHDMQERRVFQESGHSSAVHYAVARLGISRWRARQLVEAGAGLAELPRLDDAFREGRLSWSKVRLLTEVAVPRTERAWMERAGRVSCRELEHEVRHAERGSMPRSGDWGLPEVRFRVFASMDPVAHERWEEAKRRLAMELGRTVTDEDMVLYGAEAALGERRGRETQRKGSPYRIVVHQCPQCDKAAVQTRNGPEPLGPATARMVACDAPRVDPAKRPEAVDQPTPEAARQIVLARDAFRCRSCGVRWNLMVHHLVFRSRGGPSTPRNLVTLCGRCHSMVHAGLLRIEGTEAKDLRFVSRDGRALEDADPP